MSQSNKQPPKPSKSPTPTADEFQKVKEEAAAFNRLLVACSKALKDARYKLGHEQIVSGVLSQADGRLQEQLDVKRVEIWQLQKDLDSSRAECDLQQKEITRLKRQATQLKRAVPRRPYRFYKPYR